jgi:AraC-like DNA-binding protein
MIPTHDIAQSKKKDILINELVALTNYDSSEPHRHNYFEFFVFQTGGGVHVIDFVEFPIKSNSIHIVAPGQVHQVQRELYSNGFVFIFELNLFDHSKEIENFLLNHICLDVNEFNPNYQFTEDYSQEVQFVMKKAWREYNSEEPMKNQLVLNQLSELLFYCIRTQQKQTTGLKPKTNSLYIDFRRMLNVDFREKKMVKDFATALNTTEKQLNEVVQIRAGESVSTLIYKQLILEAKRLLLIGMTAKEVSYELNFSNPAHFSKFFKSQTGVSTTDFRNVHD